MICKGTTVANQTITLQFNGDAGANYNARYSLNTGADVTTGATTKAEIVPISGTNNGFATAEIQNVDLPLSGSVNGADSNCYHIHGSLYYNGASLVTSIVAGLTAGNYVAGSRLIVLGM